MLFLTLLITRFLEAFIRLLSLGSGGTWPGHVALKLYPGVLSASGISPSIGTVLISGTNGKTTTTKMLCHVLRGKGFVVTTNASGANLLNGIASSLLSGTPLFDKRRADYAVLEVDEFTLPTVLEQLKVKGIVLLNLSRDQLDRYGETDLILERWEKAVNESEINYVVLDKSFEYFREMSFTSGAEVLNAEDIPEETLPEDLKERFHAKNIKAVLTTASFLGIPFEETVLLLTDFQAAYGRGEIIDFGGINFHLFLAKNPASLTANLKAFEKRKNDFDAVLFILNDNIPDGRDVSWIYDVGPLLILSACAGKEIYVSGVRGFDMAVRLDYAGVPILEENVTTSVPEIMKRIKKSSVKNIAVFPNYSAMLDFRKMLTGRKIL